MKDSVLVVVLALLGIIALGMLLASVVITVLTKMAGILVFGIAVLLILWIGRIVYNRGK